MRTTGILLLIALLAACGSARRTADMAVASPSVQARLAAGEQLFMDYCQQCHPGGTAGLGPALNNKPLPGFAIRLQVRLGLGVMPGFDKAVISPAELDQLVDYLKVLRRGETLGE